MRNLLAFLAALTLTVAIAGWYLGWYRLSTTPGAAGHSNVSIDFNTPKIENDFHKGAVKIEHLLEKNTGTTPPSAAKTDGAFPPAAPTVNHDKAQNTIPNMLKEGTSLATPF